MKSSAQNLAPVEPEFFLRDATTVARDLIGLGISVRHGRTEVLARIVETEAYPPGDPAAHTYRGKNVRNQTMYRRGGYGYVYRSHGIHACFNVVTGGVDDGQAVLIRAAEPLQGLTFIEKNRPGHAPRDWLRGPGRLCQGMGIGLHDDGVDLLTGPIRIVRLPSAPAIAVGTSVRIGITRAADAPLRFFAAHSPFVSGRKALNHFAGQT